LLPISAIKKVGSLSPTYLWPIFMRLDNPPWTKIINKMRYENNNNIT